MATTRPGRFNDGESALDALEASWADFAHRARTGVPYVRDGTGRGRLLSLGHVRQQFDVYRARFDGGDEPALFEALVYALEEAVPVPYWTSVEVQRRWRRVWSEGVTLHEAFGLEAMFPSQGKKASTARKMLLHRQALWAQTATIMAADKNTSLDAALRRLLADARPAFPFKLTKARTLFNEQERIQQQHLAAMPQPSNPENAAGRQVLSRKRLPTRTGRELEC